jgi:hypothetical protein
MKGLQLFGVILVIVFVTGWVKNIIKLSECDFEAPYKAEVIYAVGLFPLVGAITGWIDIEDGEQAKPAEE